MEIHSVPVISTNHLTKEAAERLSAAGNKNPWCVCASWEHGLFLHLDDLEAATTEEDPVPQCLYDIRDWMRSKNLICTSGNTTFRGDWVRLDGDADTEEDLRSYDW